MAHSTSKQARDGVSSGKVSPPFPGRAESTLRGRVDIETKPPEGPSSSTALASVIEQSLPPTEDEIRVRAYDIYCRRGGGGDGSSDGDWRRAEQELRAERGLR